MTSYSRVWTYKKKTVRGTRAPCAVWSLSFDRNVGAALGVGETRLDPTRTFTAKLVHMGIQIRRLVPPGGGAWAKLGRACILTKLVGPAESSGDSERSPGRLRD